MEARALQQMIVGPRQILIVVHRVHVHAFHHIHGFRLQKYAIVATRLVIILSAVFVVLIIKS